MTVAELIKLLQDYPRQDDTVMVETWNDWGGFRGVIDKVVPSRRQPYDCEYDCELTYVEEPI